MSDPYSITFGKALIDSGALESVQIEFRRPDAQSQGRTPSFARNVSSSLSTEPAYYSCVDASHGVQRNKYYVVTKGVKPGIYYCWSCAKFEGKGADRLPPGVPTYCEKKTSDEQAREFWHQEFAGGNVCYWIPRGAHVAKPFFLTHGAHAVSLGE
ncbi:hypothetical protein PENSPDRAFT_693441 [Peniophora sp. CONT]|nr:hypothetical protein PENSPDRAFT_693441 [Peniophora sp. CONT]